MSLRKISFGGDIRPLGRHYAGQALPSERILVHRYYLRCAGSGLRRHSASQAGIATCLVVGKVAKATQGKTAVEGAGLYPWH